MGVAKSIAASAMIALVQQMKADDAQTNRPIRPAKPAGVETKKGERPNLSEVQSALLRVRTMKSALKSQQKATSEELRAQAREQLTEAKAAASGVRHEFNESLVEARDKAQEQARKLAEESREVLRNTDPVRG